MRLAQVSFVVTVGVAALGGSTALRAQDAQATVKDPISPADCLKDKKKASDCLKLGILYAEGKEVPTDLTKGIAFLDAACRQGVRAACHVKAWFLLKRNASAADVVEGLRILEDTCEHHVPGACSALGQAYASGTGVARDVPKAATLLQKDCDVDAYSCMALAGLLDIGDGIPADADRARALVRKACELGPFQVCEQSCEAGNGNACVAFGDRLRRGKQPDIGRANRAYQRACDAAVAEGCYYLAWLTKEPEQTLPLFERACSLEYAPACVAAGQRYLLGRGAEIDLAKAARLYAKACDKGARAACCLLGGIHARGELGNDEVAKGRVYLDKACGEDAECHATVASGRVPSAWGGSLEALRPVASEKGCEELPRLLYQTEPVYPRRAHDRKIMGVVHLSITIDIDGRVSDVRVVRGIPDLDAAAVECVRQWQFTPEWRNGVAVVSVAEAPITFLLR